VVVCIFVVSSSEDDGNNEVMPTRSPCQMLANCAVELRLLYPAAGDIVGAVRAS
jgi:hypothetical protein